MGVKKSLTEKQRKFAIEFMKDGNASRAYRASYDASKMVDTSVYGAAQELLKHPLVSVEISRLQSNADKKNKFELDRILNEFGEIAFSNIIDIFDYDSIKDKIILKGGAKKLSELPREITACIQSLKQGKDGIEVKLYSKDNALAQIARIKGYFSNDKLNVEVTSFEDFFKSPDDD